MSINIKNREVEALLAEIKLMTGKGPSAVVLELARKEVERLRRERNIDERRRKIVEIVREARSKIPENAPSIDEIVGYDEYGLPR